MADLLYLYYMKKFSKYLLRLLRLQNMLVIR